MRVNLRKGWILWSVSFHFISKSFVVFQVSLHLGPWTEIKAPEQKEYVLLSGYCTDAPISDIQPP